jgi:hypothetical protein
MRLVTACSISPAGIAEAGGPLGLIDNQRVFAGMGLSLVDDLAAIEAVLQYQVERTAREWLAAENGLATRAVRARGGPPVCDAHARCIGPVARLQSRTGPAAPILILRRIPDAVMITEH